uniref:NADH-ubiquinone oxidoreductase chain 2 n=6 Tax=Hemidactylus nzingae TaxID=2716614 RepID=A0A6G7NT97_9SAUR|nr:ND2 [Hemidactylus nzingae]
MNPLVWSLLITALATSTLITMSSNHWFLAWLGLELNTLSILPIMMKHHHPRATEAATKYFLIQATAAASILFASTINAWQTGHWSLMHNNSTTTMTLATVAIMMKLGIAPMHLWYPEALQGIPMNTAMLISTWQKIAPLTFLYLLHSNLNPTMMLTIGLISAAVGGWTGLNQTQTRKIMAFSSIAHMGWLLVALNFNPHLATLTAILYLIATTATFTILSSTTTKTITDMGTTWTTSPTMLTTAMITLLSLGGLPPLTGFVPKWLILNELTSMNLPTIGLMLLTTSLPSLFFYTRMAYVTTLTTPPTTTNTKLKWRMTTTLSSTSMIVLTWFMIPMTTALYNTT